MFIKQWVLEIISKSGRTGITDGDVFLKSTGYPASTLRGCRKQLERSDLCEGCTKTLNDNGRLCTLYRITERGKQFLKFGQILPVDRAPDTEHTVLSRISRMIKAGYIFEISGTSNHRHHVCLYENENCLACFHPENMLPKTMNSILQKIEKTCLSSTEKVI